MKRKAIIFVIVVILCCCLIFASCSALGKSKQTGNQAGIDNNTPDDTPGGNTPGGDTPGGDTPGGDELNGGDDTEILVFSMEMGTYNVVGYATAVEVVVIPATYEDIPVTGIADGAFEDCDTLTTVTFEEGSQLESIGEGAFYSCDALETIELPSTVKSIGDYAFTGCSSLKNLSLPNDIEAIGFGVFSECVSLTSITIPSGVESIGAGAFDNCYALSELVIPEGVKSIGERAFLWCIGIVSVTLPSSLETIESQAFECCEKLVEVYNKSSLDIVAGSYEFGSVAANALNVYTQADDSKITKDANGYLIYEDGADKLLLGYSGTSKDLVLPDGITEIYDYAFFEMMKINSVTIPNTVTTIGANAFERCQNMLSITIPENVATIGDYAFGNDFRLIEVCNKSSLDIVAGSGEFGSVAKNALNVYTQAGGSKLSVVDDDFVVYTDGEDRILVGYLGSDENVTIPSTVNSTRAAFYSCEKVKRVTIPKNVTAIGDRTFDECTGLRSITIPNSIESIGKSAFENCYFMREVIFEENSVLTTIDEYAFATCLSLTTITIPSSVTTINEGAFSGCLCLAEVFNKSALNIEAGSDENGEVAVMAKNVYTQAGESKLSIVNDDFVVYTDGEEKILVRYIGENSTVAIPDEITKIDFAAFYYDYRIINVGIPSSVKEIGDYAFVFCKALRRLVFDENSQLENIGEDVLLESSNFGRVFYHGTEAEWEAITMSPNEEGFNEVNMYYYSATEPTQPGNYWHIVEDVLVIW